MARQITREEWLEHRVEGWQDKTGRWVTGVTCFLLLSGLTIFALPFSVFNQHAVIVHTVVAVLYTIPAGLYLTRHLRTYWDFPLTHVKFSGYVSGIMTLVCAVSGFWLTFEGLFGTRITYFWRDLHIVATFGLLLFLVAHLASLWARARRPSEESLAGAPGGWMRVTLGSFLGLLLVTGALTFVIRPVAFANDFPSDYEMTPYEGAGPFSPSLAMSQSGGALDPLSLSGSASCGTTGCHEEIYKEWLPSAHRFSAMDVGFQKVQSVMAEQNGATSTRYCGGCHDPISLFSGTKNIGVDNLTDLIGYQEGISCLACHAIEETDVAGNANYKMGQPERYVWELRDGALATTLSEFLIRTYPKKHVETLSRRMFKSPEFCAACHKQFIDEEVNEVGWVQLQNQFDNWRASRWHNEDDPERTVECRECHMPLHDSTDPAAGDEADDNRTADDGKHRSHSFLGGNQYVPTVLELEGAEAHVAQIHEWLKGNIEIPEIAHKWREGPAVPIELEVPETVVPGEEMRVRVHLVNNKVGHDFPTGPLDIIQAWVEVTVTDANGVVVFHTGKKGDDGFIETGSYMFKAEPVDRAGNLIDRHNLWEMVGVRFKRSLFPGSEEVASFTFDCDGVAPDPDATPELSEDVSVTVPADLAGPLTVVAKLNYRKFDQYLLNFLFTAEAGLSSTVTEMSTDTARVRVVGASE
jgi:hypothetical protein